MLLKIDRASEVPAYRQIYERVVALVDEGALRPGDPLPPSRALGPSIGVHRSTVVRAYDELRALGWNLVCGERAAPGNRPPRDRPCGAA